MMAKCKVTFAPSSAVGVGEKVDPLRRRTFAGYSRHFWSAKIPCRQHNKLVWSNRWYTPDDLRSSTPVQRHKFLSPALPDLSSLPHHWVPLSEAPLKAFSRAAEETCVHTSAPSTRSEQWSTLRQMLPSRGQCVCHRPPRWGTDFSTPPRWSRGMPKRFPHINSPMTNYVDDMHLTNRLFKLH